MELPRQEYWSGWPFPSPGDLPNPEIESGSSSLQADSLLFELPGKPNCTPIKKDFFFEKNFFGGDGKFPGSPVVRILGFQYQEPGFNPWSGN